MRDRLFFPALALAALLMVALAAVWPQGLGDRSWGAFGHTPVQRTPAMQAAMKRESDASNQRLNQARQAVSDLQSQAISPTQ
ncbi:hypothetical protein [Phenylobacterium sp.]|uniref:hypothetical protein n=1 Tax=Phenylobacterium sp. TaxID=1871053 RepID=UPI00271B1799|nr:hypothetical protein [Phenylobacterium sp.]MDO8378220.1 hypothetical protein [Phenylobacterium sp.]